MQANREGIFLATVGDHSVAPNGPNKLTTFIANYGLVDEITPDGSMDIVSEGLTITGYHYLEKKDGSINTFTIDKLKEAYGWDGRDPFWLEDSLPENILVKLTLENDTNPQNNKTTLKVKYIDHRDSTGGGVVHASDAEKTAIRNRLGAKLRAISGGTPSKPPAPTGKPTLPPAASSGGGGTATLAPPRTRTAPAKVAVVGTTQADAWAAFTKDIKPETSEDYVQKQWAEILEEMFPGKGDDDMTPADWAKVRDEAPAKYLPF